MNPSTIEILATCLFGLAILHTFMVKRFEILSHRYPSGSVGENLFHLLAEVEVVFGIPGLGELFVKAMAVRDYNIMQGIVLISMLGVLFAGLIVDLALPLLDPRIRVTQ